MGEWHVAFCNSDLFSRQDSILPFFSIGKSYSTL
jgi:hypothetical protein